MSKPAIEVVTTPLAALDTPLLALAIAEGAGVPASLAALDQAGGGVLGRAIASGDFSGKRDETSLLYPAGGKTQRILLVGMGNPAEVTRTSIRRAAAVAAHSRALAELSSQIAAAVRRAGR